MQGEHRRGKQLIKGKSGKEYLALYPGKWRYKRKEHTLAT